MLEFLRSPLELTQIQSLENVNSHLDQADHQVNLNAIASNTLAINEVGKSLTNDQKLLILKRLNLDGLTELDELPLTASFMIEKVECLSYNEAFQILEEVIVDLKHDINIPNPEFELYENLVKIAVDSDDLETSVVHESTKEALKEKYYTDVKVKEADEDSVNDSTSFRSFESKYYSPYTIVDWKLQMKLEAALIAYHSPYQEVRCVTDPYDDPSIPIETLRVYIIGIIWTCISAFVNEFFNDRMPGISLPSSVIQMFIYPCGKAFEFILPKYKFKVLNYVIDLNPGPWTFKEQILSSLMASYGGGGSYVAMNITVQKLDMFYGNEWVTFGYQVLLVLSTNFMGVGFAGILRKFVIYPIKSVWPGILPTLALNKALLLTDKKENINGWTISRYNFFFSVMSASFLYYWFPGYLFQALSYFNWMNWIKPNNFQLATVAGMNSGLGLNPISSFDWNVFGTGSLLSPFYSIMNQYVGSIIGFLCIIGVYYSNYRWTAYLPINSNRLFTNTGDSYKVENILTSDSLFDQEKYDNYGPPFYTAANLVIYGTYMALYPFAIIHELSVSWKSLWFAFKDLGKSLIHFRGSSYHGFKDPHCTMMKHYEEVPDWVFLAVLIISFVLAIVCVELFPVNAPVWTIVFALGINFVFLIPLTTLESTTGFTIGLDVLVELIMGYALPGNGEALMFVKALGYNIDGQADSYISNQKLAHYSKVPPRSLFRTQILGLLIGSFVNLAAINFKLGHVKDYCHPLQKDKFTCPNSNTYFAASVVWGVIGPKKVFDGLYPILKYCFLIGFLLSIPCVLIRFYVPPKHIKYFQPSLIIGGILIYAPMNLCYYTGAVYVSAALMVYVKSRYSSWWSKYNYVFGSAMNAGLAFCSVIIFFSVQYNPKNISWWGNNVSFEGVEGGIGRTSLMNASLADSGYFGPRRGHFP